MMALFARPRTRWLPDWLTLAAAVLIVFSFPPWDVTPLIWLALIPWLAALRRSPDWKAALIQGAWLSFFMTVGGFYWVAAVLHEFGNLPWSIATLGLLLFGFVGQPQFLAAAPLLYWVETRTAGARGLRAALLGLTLAASYAGLDWVIPKIFVDTLGHSFYASANFRQAADLGGAHLLTFAIFLVSHGLWRFADRMRNRREPSWWPAIEVAGPELAVGLVLCASLWSYGHVRLREIQAEIDHPLASFTAAVIQGNIGDFDKIASERGIRGAGEKVLETFFGLSDKALAAAPRPDVLIWPETSYPSTFRTPQSAEELARDQQVERYVRDRGVPLLFGGYDRARGKDFNSFFFLSPQAAPGFPSDLDLQTYHKNILLLFGEYIPGAETFKFIRDAFPQVGNFGRGAGPDVLKIYTKNHEAGTVLTGPIICYEALFPNYVIAAARKGSQLILNITNDSWFGPLGEPDLHLALVTFRSIETRLPQIRSTNTGVSAVILPTGEISQKTAIGEAEVMNARIPLTRAIPTLMKKWGDWFGGFALVAGLLGCAVALRRRLG